LEIASRLYSIDAGYVMLFIGCADMVIVGFLLVMTYLGKLHPIEQKPEHLANMKEAALIKA
jgi:hypothetical protein